MKPWEVGNVSEAAVLKLFLEKGWVVAIPWGGNQRYDYVVDMDGTGQFKRVQVKSGRARNGVVEFRPCSSYSHWGGPKRTYTDKDVDYFAVYVSSTGDVFLVPVAVLKSKWYMSLRVEPTKNGQRDRVLWAKDFICTSPAPSLAA